MKPPSQTPTRVALLRASALTTPGRFYRRSTNQDDRDTDDDGDDDDPPTFATAAPARRAVHHRHHDPLHPASGAYVMVRDSNRYVPKSHWEDPKTSLTGSQTLPATRESATRSQDWRGPSAPPSRGNQRRKPVERL